MPKITTNSAPKKKSYTFVRVGENLYRVKETGGYYALVKRNRKQIRRSLKTTDKALAKRRLNFLLQTPPAQSTLLLDQKRQITLRGEFQDISKKNDLYKKIQL